MAKRGRGRPPRTDWITPAQLARLPIGTAVVIDHGTHKPTTRGRIGGVMGDLIIFTDERIVRLERVARARVIAGLLEPGTAVLRRGSDALTWRGVVVRCRGREVEVERRLNDDPATDGFEWVAEADLVPADFGLHTRARVSLAPEG